MIKVIFAHGSKGEFGTKEGLPWDEPVDLAIFKNFTSDCILVMGGATFNSLPRLLPGRPHIVLSDREARAKNGDAPTLQLNENTSLETLCEFLDASSNLDVCVIGGRKFIQEAIYFADRVSISAIRNSGPAEYHIDHSAIYGYCDILLELLSIHSYPGFDHIMYKKGSM